jgi:hypothetical protein
MANKKVFVIITVANQIDGAVTLVKVEKVFSNARDAENFLAKEKTNWREMLNFNNSSFECICERGVQEADFEDKEN